MTRDTTLREPDEANGVTEQDLIQWNHMVSGRVYRPGDPYIMGQRASIGLKVSAINMCEDHMQRMELQKELCGTAKESRLLWMPPLWCQYGHIRFGEQVLISPGSHILDVCPIFIGTRTMIGANSTILSGGHSPYPHLRWSDTLSSSTADGAPIHIGQDCFIGANVTILQGVRIGDGTTIGSGSVVVSDIPDGCVALGHPCKVIKRLDQEGKQETLEEYEHRFRNGDNGGKMKWIPAPLGETQTRPRSQ